MTAIMRTPVCVLVLLLSAASNLWAEPISTGTPPTARDLEPPRQDLETLEGEVVWLQAALLRGDPTPYRDPRMPLAAYEQGILDEEGRMWTILDTPKGRELRYNPDLRGQRIKVKGWLYPESKIINVQTWGDSQAHPVRVNESYPQPKKIPFDPSKAEPIETIKPVAPETLQPDLLDNSLWKIQEGTDLGRIGPATPTLQILDTQDSARFHEILQESGLLPAPAEGIQKSQESLGQGTSKEIREEISGIPLQATSSPAVPKLPTPAPSLSPQTKILNEEGEPLARPEEFDEALQKSLFE